MGYCVKCREKREVAEAKDTTNAKGRAMIRGKCSTCGTGMCVIGKKIADYDQK